MDETTGLNEARQSPNPNAVNPNAVTDQDANQKAEALSAASVWPPPPTNGPPLTAAYPSVPVFVPVQRLARAIMVLLTVHASLSALALAASLLPTSSSRMTDAAVSILQLLLLLATGICFLFWTYRMDANLRAFGLSGLQFEPGWAVGYFFVPVMNLYRPYQVFREIWQASDPDAAGQSFRTRRKVRPPVLLGLWWVCWLLTNVVDTLAAQDAGARDVSTVGAGFRLVSAILVLLIVRLFTDRQEKTARHLP